MKFTKEQLKIIDYMYKSLKASGYDDVSISGIIGNALTESSLNPDSVSESKTYHGLFLNDKNIRLAVINKYGDYSAKSLMKYAHDWVTGADWVKLNKYTLTNAGKFKRSGYKDAHEASDAWMRLYERPVIVDKAGNVIGYQGLDLRRANATAMYDYINTNYNNIRTTTTDKGKKITIPITAYQDPPQYESTYQLPKQTNTIYPLNPKDRTVPSLDAWNGADSPSAGPNIPSLLKSMDERKRMFDLFSDNAIAIGKKKTLPNLRNVLDRKMEDYIAGIMGVPDVYEEPGYTYTPMMYSPMPVFADGKPADYTWHQNWLNQRQSQFDENYNSSTEDDKARFEAAHSGNIDHQIENLLNAKEYNDYTNFLNELALYSREHRYPKGISGMVRPNKYEDGGIIWYNPHPTGIDQQDLETHERTHALARETVDGTYNGIGSPQASKIDKINKLAGENLYYKGADPMFPDEDWAPGLYTFEYEPDHYLDTPNEIYSEVMAFRKKMGLKPTDVITIDDIRRWRGSNRDINDRFKEQIDISTEELPFSLLRFSDEVLLLYFNDVASIDGALTHRLPTAKNGKLPEYRGGKGSVLDDVVLAYDNFVENDPYYIASIMSYLPIVGTAMDVREAIKNPTAENIGYAGLSGLTDLVGGKIFTKIAGDIIKAKRTAKAVKKAELDFWRNTPFYLSMPKRLAEDTVKYYAEQAADLVLDAANTTREFIPEARLLPAASVYFPDFLANMNQHSNKQLPGHKDGKSPIRIKPENRGKLTRLKKRTGKSESELYNDGNPAHKKMVVFARNARKWKH